MENNEDTFYFADRSEKLTKILDKMVEIAKPENAFNKPVESQGHTVIAVSEVSASMGVGFGSGVRPQENANIVSKKGGGGGGGGYCSSRPVASIVISANGVTVQPIFDFTKIAIAALTTVGSMIIFMSRILRTGR